MSERSSLPRENKQNAYHYVGDELDLFAGASHWKEYVRYCLMPHIRGSVLEVGAGIGGTTTFLRPGDHRDWRCLEPDPKLAAILEETLRQNWPRFEPDVLVGSIEALAGEQNFDTILYIDVLEHIEDDRAELARAAALLASRGRLVVLSPAHNYLFSEFDRAIGHFRRYNRKLLRLISPSKPEASRTVLFGCGGDAALARQPGVAPKPSADIPSACVLGSLHRALLAPRRPDHFPSTGQDSHRGLGKGWVAIRFSRLGHSDAAFK